MGPRGRPFPWMFARSGRHPRTRPRLRNSAAARPPPATRLLRKRAALGCDPGRRRSRPSRQGIDWVRSLEAAAPAAIPLPWFWRQGRSTGSLQRKARRHGLSAQGPGGRAARAGPVHNLKRGCTSACSFALTMLTDPSGPSLTPPPSLWAPLGVAAGGPSAGRAFFNLLAYCGGRGKGGRRAHLTCGGWERPSSLS